MKKIITLTLVCVMLLSVFSSCKKEKVEKLQYVEFYYYKTESQMNILSTKENYLQRYIEGKGTEKVSFNISQTDLQEIFKEIKENKLDEISGEIKTKPNCGDKITKYILKFKIDKEEYELKGDYTSYDHVKESEDTKRFCNFVQYIMEYMRSTDEFNSIK